MLKGTKQEHIIAADIYQVDYDRNDHAYLGITVTAQDLEHYVISGLQEKPASDYIEIRVHIREHTLRDIEE